MQTVSSLEELSLDELGAIRRQLQRRFGIGNRGNIIDVAFGMAEANGQLDPSRPDSICFYVRHKRKPRAKIDRIPATIDCRLKRGRRFVRVRLATDVILLGTRQVRPSGEPISHSRSRGNGITGGVIGWRLSDRKSWTWGVITVGHLFANLNVVPESTPLVRIGRPSANAVAGTLIARSKPFNRQQVDAAIVMVPREQLVAADMLPETSSTRGKRIRPVTALKNDQGKQGFSFPRAVIVKLRVVRFLPISDLVPALGSLRFVVEAIAMPGTFAVGRSGSMWAVQRQAAGIQHGGLPTQFHRGWGQSLEFALQWCVQEIAILEDVAADDVDLRLMRVI